MDYVSRFHLEPHVEGGAFRELYRDGARPPERPASGVIYYQLGQGESSRFHTLDSDEYWFYHAGPPIELWLIEDGLMTRHLLGMAQGCAPCVLMPKNTVFGARHLSASDEATLVSCLTVPEFSYAHYRILSEEEAVKLCPEAKQFFEA